MCPIVTTPPSIGSMVRETMLCSAVRIWPAIMIGSMPLCGSAPCAPLPEMSISILPTAAMIGPLPHWNVLVGMEGQLCSPNTISIGQRSNSPSCTMIPPPPKLSSAGWKIRYTVPSKLRVSAR